MMKCKLMVQWSGVAMVRSGLCGSCSALELSKTRQDREECQVLGNIDTSSWEISALVIGCR